MSSSTIDIGIDLGTSNSAVAVAHEGEVEAVRNNDNDQITPSVVRYLQNGSIQVGRKAYEHYRLSEDGSSFGRFKRDMGRRKSYPVPTTGSSVGPEALAAELLKSLRADAESWVGHTVTAAVITVPAMFELAQCDATQRAAALAGITQAPLLQEPIAAGLAYGYERDLSDAYFLVYDLGGGTFDATLMRVSDGSLTVIDTVGDNFLGSRDWDRKLAGLMSERIVAAGHQLWPIEDPAGKEFRRRLDLIAESEKIQLSRREQVDVVFDGQLHDVAGRPIEGTFPLTRGAYEQLIVHDIERSIELLNVVLERQNLPASAIAHILLVGGPTRTPLLRRMVAAMTGIATETRIDPMTVVAEGAARFAAGVPRDAGQVAVSVPSSVTRLSLSYPSSTDDLVAHVGGRVESTTAAQVFVEIRRADGGWASGRIPAQENVFFTSVALQSRRSNTFEIGCFDESGRTIPVTPDTFIITQGLMASEPPLARSVIVAYLNSDDKAERGVLLGRGTKLPAVVSKSFRTARAASPGRFEDALNIHVLEGEFERPDLNRPVGVLRITGDHLDRTLPAGTPIEVTMRIDTSRKVTVSAYIPLLDVTFEEILDDQVLHEDDPRIVSHELSQDLERAHSSGAPAAEIARLEERAAEIRDDITAALAGDSDRASRADRHRKELADEVDRIVRSGEVPLLIEEVNAGIVSAQGLVNEHGDARARQRLALLRTEADTAIQSGRADEIRRMRDEIYRFQWQLVWDQPSFWVNRFIYLSEAVEGNNDSAQVTSLLRSGRAALDRQDIEGLRNVCWQLWEYLPQDQRDDTGLRDIGLRA